MKSITKEVIKIVLIVLIISIIWLVFSERIILFFIENDETVTNIQRVKGLLYILIFTLIIYIFIRGEVRNNKLKCEKKLAEEKSKKAILFDSANDAIFILDEKNEFVDCNSMTLDLFKCSKDQIIGITPSDVSPKYQQNGIESEQLVKEKIERAKKGEKQIFEWIHTDIDKTEEFLTEVSINSKKISDKEFIIVVVRDISERTKKEIALKENEFFLKEAQKIAKLGHWRLDYLNNKLSWSEEVYRIFEQSQQEFKVTPRTFLNLVHPEDRDKLQEASEKSLKNKVPHEFEHRLLLKNGKIKYVIEKSITEYDMNGKPLHSIGTVQDITKQKIAQQQLKESEERYKLLSDLSNEGVVVHKKGVVIDVNSTFCNMFKYNREELVGSNPMEKIFTPESLDIIKQNIHNEITSTYEATGVNKNGTLIQLEIEARNFMYQNEKVRVAVLRDISDKIEKDKELKESEERFRTHYNNMPIASYTWQQKDDDFVLIEYNGAAEEATKGSMKKLIGKKLSFIYEDKKDIIKDIYSCYKTKKLIQKEMPYKSRIGDNKILDVTYVFVPQNNVIVHTVDITERIKAQNFLKESEAKYRLLVENGPSVFWIIDKNGNTKYISDNVKKIYGFSAEEIRNKGSIIGIDRIHKQDIKNVMNNFKAIFTENKRFDISYRIKNKNDKWIWLQVIGEKYILNSGEEVAYGVFRDITDKKNAQQKVYHAMIGAEERERSRIAKDLHDGVSPILSAIKLYMRSFLSAKDEVVKGEVLNKINLTINEAIQSLSDISNKLSPHILQNFGLSTAIQSFIEKVSENTDIHFNFIYDIDNKPDENIEVNLYRIIVELINNTVKYADAKNAIIKISENENEVKMYFEHNGKGFNLEEVRKKSKGMGLRNLFNRINSLNGKMYIKTNIDSGLKVDIVIPVNI
jgi:PAS domain S-box-containing protein